MRASAVVVVPNPIAVALVNWIKPVADEPAAPVSRLDALEHLISAEESDAEESEQAREGRPADAFGDQHDGFEPGDWQE